MDNPTMQSCRFYRMTQCDDDQEESKTSSPEAEHWPANQREGVGPIKSTKVTGHIASEVTLKLWVMEEEKVYVQTDAQLLSCLITWSISHVHFWPHGGAVLKRTCLQESHAQMLMCLHCEKQMNDSESVYFYWMCQKKKSLSDRCYSVWIFLRHEDRNKLDFY